MCPIVHLSLKVAEVEKTGDFYRQVFGFKDTETYKTRDHVSRHMSDGAMDFTLIRYDAGSQSAQSRAAGDGPCIHHFAVQVDDVAKATELVKANGGEIISDAGVLPVKFRAVGGTVAELVPAGRYQRPAVDKTTNRIVHIALSVEDVQKTGDFYRRAFGYEDAVLDPVRTYQARHMTDGRIDFSLLPCAGEPPCIHHFALEVDDVDRAAAQVKSHGCRIVSAPGVLPVKFEAPGGILAELVPVGRYQRRIA